MGAEGSFYHAIKVLPTLWFFAIMALIFGFFLMLRGVKPAASCILALSSAGTVGGVLTFVMTVVYKLGLSLSFIHYNIMFSFLVTVAFPSHIISPIVFYFSAKRYFSERPDYTVGYVYVLLVLVLLGSAVLSHLLVTDTGSNIQSYGRGWTNPMADTTPRAHACHRCIGDSCRFAGPRGSADGRAGWLSSSSGTIWRGMGSLQG